MTNDKVMSVSPLVYKTYTSDEANESDDLRTARTVIEMFRAADKALPLDNGEQSPRSRWSLINKHLDEVLDGTQVRENVMVFRLRKDADQKNLVCIYRFP
jgi:hypothetical protein